MRWVRAGHDVTVITCIPNVPSGVPYEGFKSTWRQQREVSDGIEILRVWSWLAPNAGFFRRSLHYITFMLSATWAGLFVSRPDVVIATTPQLLCGYAGGLLHRIRRIPFVLEVRDLWPESIAVVGAMRRGWLFRLLKVMETRLYASANRVVAVTAAMGDAIQSSTPDRTKVSVVENGVDLDLFDVCSDSRMDRFKVPTLSCRFVVGYVGTIGLAHGLEVLVDALRLLKQQGREDIGALMVGDGANLEPLRALAATYGVADQLRFTGRVPRSEVPGIMCAVDALLIHLLPSEFFRTVVPSKLFEAMAMDRPVLISVPGEATDLVLRESVGLKFEAGSAESLATAMRQLADDPALYSQLSDGRARQVVRKSYSRDELASQLLAVLQEAATL